MLYKGHQKSKEDQYPSLLQFHWDWLQLSKCWHGSLLLIESETARDNFDPNLEFQALVLNQERTDIQLLLHHLEL